MADIATLWNGADGGDWLLAGNALQSDDGLQTAVVLSLFTDRLADADELDAGASGDASRQGRRGWWGDAHAPVQGDRIGSRLWLLGREKQLPLVLRRAEEYAAEALQWLVDDGVATAVNVSAEVARDGVLALAISIRRNAQPAASYRFEAFWKGA